MLIETECHKKFIEKLKSKGLKYDYYFLTLFVNRSTPIKIKSELGIHQISPVGLLKRSFYARLTLSTVLDKDKYFIDRSNILHNFKYSYFKVIYKSESIKVTITCPKHGDFEQKPKNHRDGKGCSECAREKNREKTNFWQYSKWADGGKASKQFSSYKVYVIRCFNENEHFFKIGKTFQDVNKRFRSTYQLPYLYETIYLLENDNPQLISEAENTLKNNNKEFSYVPKIHFGGKFECFSEFNLIL